MDVFKLNLRKILLKKKKEKKKPKVVTQMIGIDRERENYAGDIIASWSEHCAIASTHSLIKVFNHSGCFLLYHKDACFSYLSAFSCFCQAIADAPIPLKRKKFSNEFRI